MTTCSKPGCECGGAELPRSTHPYSAIPVRLKVPGQREPAWACQCVREDGTPVLRKYRHQHPAECIPTKALASWRRANPEVTASDRTARFLYWMELEFSRKDAHQEKAS